jgi:hypothetical protein
VSAGPFGQAPEPGGEERRLRRVRILGVALWHVSRHGMGPADGGGRRFYRSRAGIYQSLAQRRSPEWIVSAKANARPR